MSLSLSTLNPVKCTNLMQNYTSTVTSGSTTTLTAASNRAQYFTGVTAQTCVLPVVSTLTNGYGYEIVNRSTGLITIQTSALVTIITVPTGGRALLTCIDTTGSDGVGGWFSVLQGVGGVFDTAASPTYPTDLTKGVWYGLNTKANAFDATCITLGQNANTDAADDIAIGKSASAVSANAIAIGNTVVATSNGVVIGSSLTDAASQFTYNNVIIGRNYVSQIFTNYNVVIGNDLTIVNSSGSCVNIGRGNTVGTGNSASGGICIGHNCSTQSDSLTAESYGISIGGSATSSGDAIAIGRGANSVSTRRSIAIGQFATAIGGIGVIAVGPAANATGLATIAIGNTVSAVGDNSMVIGANTSVSSPGTNCIAIGNGAQCNLFATNNTLLGVSTYATGSNQVAVGYDARCGFAEPQCTAVGALSRATGNGSTAFGYDAQGTGISSVALGRVTRCATQSVAVGDSAVASGSYAVALGNITTAVANAIGIGRGVNAGGTGAIGIGLYTISTGEYSVMVGSSGGYGGYGAFANYSTGVGFEATATATQAIAVGRRAHATAADAISVGSFATSAGTNAIVCGNTVHSGSGANSIIIGTSAGDSNNTGANNIMLGSNTLSSSATFNGSIVASSNVLTLNTAAVGTFLLGMRIKGLFVAANTQILTLLTGVLGAAGSTYSISASPLTTTTDMTAYSIAANNIGVGENTLIRVLGAGNTAIGFQSGVALGLGDNNTLLGASTSVSETVSNALVVGAGASATASGSIALGQGITANVSDGFFVKHRNGITPTAAHIAVYDNATSEMTGLPYPAGSGYVLTSDNSGAVTWSAPSSATPIHLQVYGMGTSSATPAAGTYNIVWLNTKLPGYSVTTQPNFTRNVDTIRYNCNVTGVYEMSGAIEFIISGVGGNDAQVVVQVLKNDAVVYRGHSHMTIVSYTGVSVPIDWVEQINSGENIRVNVYADRAFSLSDFSNWRMRRIA